MLITPPSSLTTLPSSLTTPPFQFRPAEKKADLPDNVHTRSDVVIGNHKLFNDYYDTSTGLQFQPIPVKGCQDIVASGLVILTGYTLSIDIDILRIHIHTHTHKCLHTIVHT